MDEAKSLGDQLRQARENQQKTLAQIHQQTGISHYVLQGLESGDFTIIEPVYIRLALRSYAEHLGLNAASIVQQFDRIFYQPSSPPPPKSVPPQRRSWVRWLAGSSGKR